MYYPAKFEKEDDAYVITFRDIPEAISQGESYRHAVEMAEDVLICCVELYFDEGRAFPFASDTQADETEVFLPETIYAKVLLHNEMLAQGVKKADLSRLTGIKPPEIQRILTPRHNTKIDTVSRALRALGKPLKLSL